MRRQIRLKPEVVKAFDTVMLETIAKSQPHHDKIIPPVKIIFCDIGATGGYYIPRRNHIIINPQFFTKPGGYEQQLNQTTPHEVAHYIVEFIWPNKVKPTLNRRGKIVCKSTVEPHGWQWQRVMGWIGKPATVCHHMDTEGIVNRQERPYKYQCSPNCKVEHMFTERCHLSAQKWVEQGGTRWYKCRKCRNKLVYAGRIHKDQFIPAIKRERTEVKPVIPTMNVTTPVTPKPAGYDLKPSGFRIVTKFINGTLQAIRVPVEA